MSKLLLSVEARDISDIQSYLKANITVNPNDSENVMKTALKQIELKNLPVWEQHDGATFNTNQAGWTQDYFVDLQVDLQMNFSKERFTHMLDVGKAAFPIIATESTQTNTQGVAPSKSLTQSRGKKMSSTSSVNGKKDQTLLYGGIAAVVVILAIVLIKMIKND